MKLLSLFDGSGAFPLAAQRHGIIARYASEVEPFPIAVTRQRFPDMEHLGDITKINGGDLEPCDIISFGSPCTDISIAGKGGGLAAARSGLFFEATRIIGEMLQATNGEFPRYFLFENVPNLLSIHKGEDWKIVMDAFTDLGFICNPNILDSQEFGIAQRRKRIFVVGINRRYYDPTDFFGIPCYRHKRMEKAVKSWGGQTFHGITSRYYAVKRQHLSEILEHNVDEKFFLSVAACLGILRRVDSKGKEIPLLLRSALEYQAGLYNGETADGEVVSFLPGATSRLPSNTCWNEVSPTLRAATNTGDNAVHVAFAVENRPNDNRIKLKEDGICQTLDARMGMGGGNCAMAAVPRAFGIASVSSNSMNSGNPHSGVYETDSAKTLDTSCQTPKNQGGLVICCQGNMVGRKPENGPAGKGVQENLAYTLSTVDTPAVAYSMTTGSFPTVNEGKVGTLTARDYKDVPLTGYPTYGIDRAAYNAGSNAQYKPQITEESAYSLTARGPGAVSAPPEYIVRRLTPRECLKLMDLPPDWCNDIAVAEPTETDFSFWESVFLTVGKRKSRKQIATFLRKPYSDSACYKCCGNGIVVAIADWIFAGIMEHLNP